MTRCRSIERHWLAYNIDTLLTLNEADFKRYADKITLPCAH